MLNEPTSKRTIDGIAHMNYLHSGYRKAGKITDANMLYTLSLFALEPIRWTRRFEWRALTDMETCAIGTVWKDMGDAMEIPYTALKSGATGFRRLAMVARLGGVERGGAYGACRDQQAAGNWHDRSPTLERSTLLERSNR